MQGDCLTVTGKTVAENLASVPTLSDVDQSAYDKAVLMPCSAPFSPAGNHLLMLKGNLASESAVLKLSGKIWDRFSGPVSPAFATEGPVWVPRASLVFFSRGLSCFPFSGPCFHDGDLHTQTHT